jgi:hypothetical protein
MAIVFRQLHPVWSRFITGDAQRKMFEVRRFIVLSKTRLHLLCPVLRVAFSQVRGMKTDHFWSKVTRLQNACHATVSFVSATGNRRKPP